MVPNIYIYIHRYSMCKAHVLNYENEIKQLKWFNMLHKVKP